MELSNFRHDFVREIVILLAFLLGHICCLLKQKVWFRHFLPEEFDLENLDMPENKINISYICNLEGPITKYVPFLWIIAKKILLYLKAIILSYAKYAQETFAASKVIISNGCIILLSCSVEDVNLNFFSI